MMLVIFVTLVQLKLKKLVLGIFETEHVQFRNIYSKLKWLGMAGKVKVKSKENGPTQANKPTREQARIKVQSDRRS